VGKYFEYLALNCDGNSMQPCLMPCPYPYHITNYKNKAIIIKKKQSIASGIFKDKIGTIIIDKNYISSIFKKKTF
jgi:hypothetical protein